MNTHSKKIMAGRIGWALSASAGLALCTASMAASAQERPTAPVGTPPKANPPVFFAHTRSDIAPDPAARFGTLPNGMTYVIYKNTTPPNTASIFMRVGAGSMMEQPYQRGLAHFIEHMAFNGSKNVPEGEMIRILERDGLSFGADTNAYTSQSETVYMLNLPRTDPRAIDDSLFLMRETASNLSLDAGAIDRERGVVLGEERVRASPGYRASEASLHDTLPGQKYAERMPIGLVDVIKTAKPQALADFYRDFYRPEYTTLIVAADVDPVAMEAKIKAMFADWKPAPASPNALTDFGHYRDKGEVFRTYGDKGLSEIIDLTWLKPFDEEIETKQFDVEHMLGSIGRGILGQRYGRMARSPDTPFASASFNEETVGHTTRSYTLAIRPKPMREAAAMDAALTALRQFRDAGVTQVELDHALVRLRRQLELGVEMAPTRQTLAIASDMIGTLGTTRVLRSPQQWLDFYTAIAPQLTLANVNAHIRNTTLGDGPVVSAQGEDLHGFDREKMMLTYRTVMAKPLPPLPPRSFAEWPYTQFGTPFAVVSRTAIPGVDKTRVVFANGVVLNVKTSSFERRDIGISVRFAAGFRTLPTVQPATLYAANSLGLFDGGLGKLPSEDIVDALSGKVFNVSFGIGEDATFLAGGTDRDDFALQLQVLMAFTTDPGFRPEALDRAKLRMKSYYTALKTSPGDVLGFHAGPILHSGDARYGMPSERDFMAVRNDDVAALVKPVLARAPIEITVVGDIPIDEVVKQVGATFGTLPPRDAKPPALLDEQHFPTSDLYHVFTHEGRADQNASEIVWPTAGLYSDPQRAAGLELLAAVMTLRELDEIRERQGASYGVSAHSLASPVDPGYGYIVTQAAVRPEVDATFYASVATIVEGLKNAPVSDDELARARRPIIDRMENDRHQNGFWMSTLAGSVAQPRKIEVALAREQRLMAVTPADLQRLARTYLDMTRAVRLQAKPEVGPVKP